MSKYLIFCLIVIYGFGTELFAAVNDTSNAEIDKSVTTHYRISLLTCGPGPDIWETFGHACIRVIDSTKTDAERDKIYNYGFYEESEGNTLWDQAFRGRVVDFLDTITYAELMYEYNIKERKLEEQVFLLSEQQKSMLVAYLKDNLKRRNRYYNFDTFYDNCSTRIRDLFPLLFGKRYVEGRALDENSKLTFRDVTVSTLCPAQHKYWFGLGVNLFYASRTDKVMTNREAMFLPTLLSRAMATATIDGHPLCEEVRLIRPEHIDWGKAVNMPFILLFAISAVVLGLMISRRYRTAGLVTGNLLVFASGILGWFMLYLWMLDGEPAWKDNYGILWALPTNIFFPILHKSYKKIYAYVALCFVFVAMIFHVFRIQQIPLIEISSILLTLVWIFGYYIRVSFNK